MESDINTKAWLAFVSFLLAAMIAARGWYVVSVSRDTTYQIATQDPVSGLIADAPVELHGVTVGKVKSARLLDAHSVRILLRIDRSAPITTASVATIASRGLAPRGFTGYVYIAIENTGTDAGPLAKRPGETYPTIPTASTTSMTLDATLNQVTANVQAVTQLLQSTLDKRTVTALKQSADNLRQVTTALAANSKKLNAIVANTESASRRLAPLMDASDDSVKTLQTQILPETQALLDSSHDTVRAVQTQILPEAHQALSGVDELSSSINDAATRIERNPSIMIRGTAPPPPGPGERK